MRRANRPDRKHPARERQAGAENPPFRGRTGHPPCWRRPRSGGGRCWGGCCACRACGRERGPCCRVYNKAAQKSISAAVQRGAGRASDKGRGGCKSVGLHRPGPCVIRSRVHPSIPLNLTNPPFFLSKRHSCIPQPCPEAWTHLVDAILSLEGP